MIVCRVKINKIKNFNPEKYTKEFWDNLIEKHYIAACNAVAEYSLIYSRRSAKEFWLLGIKRIRDNKFIEEYIKDCTDAMNTGRPFNPDSSNRFNDY